MTFRPRDLPLKPVLYVSVEPSLPSFANANKPPLDKPDGSWKRTPTTMTTKLVPLLNRPQMLPSSPTTNEPNILVISERLTKARAEKWLVHQPAQEMMIMTGSSLAQIGCWLRSDKPREKPGAQRKSDVSLDEIATYTTTRKV